MWRIVPHWKCHRMHNLTKTKRATHISVNIFQRWGKQVKCKESGSRIGLDFHGKTWSWKTIEQCLQNSEEKWFSTCILWTAKLSNVSINSRVRCRVSGRFISNWSAVYPSSTLLEEVFHQNRSKSKKRKIGGLPEERSVKESRASSYTVDLGSSQSILGQECGWLPEGCPWRRGREGEGREQKRNNENVL